VNVFAQVIIANAKTAKASVRRAGMEKLYVCVLMVESHLNASIHRLLVIILIVEMQIV